MTKHRRVTFDHALGILVGSLMFGVLAIVGYWLFFSVVFKGAP